MKNLDYSNLQPLSKNTDENKLVDANKSVDIILGILDYESNFEESMRNFNCYDASSILIADNDWLKRRNYSSCKDIFYEGSILRVDFGKAYIKESAFIHYSLCIRKYQSKALVIPMSSRCDKKDNAYHPSDNISGERRLRLCKLEEGFLSTGILYMNDAKFISPGRIIKSYPQISLEIFEEIKKHLLSIIFPLFDKDYISLTNDFDSLLTEHNELKSKYVNLIHEHEKLKKMIDNQV